MPDFTRAAQLLPALALLCAGHLSYAHADTIVSTTGQLSTVNSNSPEGISWTQTGSYTNVSISAVVSSSLSIGNGAGTVYLTNMVGPGTTAAANLIAETTLSGVDFDPSAATNIFSGLTLGPGTYDLITDSNLGADGLAWEGLTSPVVTTGPDATFGGSMFSFGGSSFPPADSFAPFAPTIVFDVAITGDPAVAVTPEPSSLLLLGTGLAGSFAAAKRRLA